MRGLRRFQEEQVGQATVELAVLIPVIIVVALIVVNALEYASLCARFDRVSYDAVLVHGVSAAGDYSAQSAVQEEISAVMDSALCTFEVQVADVGMSSSEALINLSAGSKRFTCTLVFHPLFGSASIAGASFSAVGPLRHERVLVVDCYKAAIIS